VPIANISDTRSVDTTSTQWDATLTECEVKGGLTRADLNSCVGATALVENATPRPWKCGFANFRTAWDGLYDKAAKVTVGDVR
jgi:hypothetical protein